MTNKEAIEMLKTICGDCRLFPKCAYKKSECFNAIDMAIKALECKDNVPDTNVGDTISRQAAIDAADEIIARDESGNNDVVKALRAWKACIKALPSAQPEKPEQPESAKEYCAECDHIEMCRWYPYEGCEFRSRAERREEE